MYRDRLKWASFPCWYKTGIGNFVLPRLGLCSLKRWFILIHFSIFSDLAIIFSWVDIILSSLTAFVQGGKSPEITGQAFLAWFQWGFVYSLPESWCLYSLLSLCQPPSWGFFSHPIHPPPPHLYFHLCLVPARVSWWGLKTAIVHLCSWELGSSTFMFICSSEFLLVWCLWLPGA